MFDNRNQQQPTMLGTQLQQQQQVFPPQYQGVDPYAQRSPPKVNPQGSLGLQQQVQSSYVQQTPQQGTQTVYEHKVITTGQVQSPQIHQNPIAFQQASTIKSKGSYCIDWCVYFIPILFFVAILCFMSMIIAQKDRDFNQEPINNVLRSFSHNQALTPIADIVAPHLARPSSMHSHFQHKSEIELCPEGFTLTTLGEWPGINSGCICDKQIKKEGFCWAKSGCDSIDSKNAQQFQSWNGGRICQKLTIGWTKLNGNTCSEGYKKCGNVCVPTNGDASRMCPLSDLTLLNTDPTTDSDPTSLNTQVVKIGNKWYRKSYDGIPIVQFQIIPGNAELGKNSAPCFNDITSSTFESQQSYPLLKKPAIGCDEFGNFQNEVVKIDTQTAKKIHEENGILSTLHGIPGYLSYEIESDSYTLEGIRRINVNPSTECTSLTPSEVNQIVEDSEDIYSYRKWFSIIIFWICVIGLVIFVYLYLIKSRNFQTLNVSQIKQPKILILIAVIVAILCIIFGSLYLYNMNGDDGLRNLDSKFKSQLDNECFSDKGIKNSVEQLHNFAYSQYSTIGYWVTWAFWLSIAFFILIIVLIIIQRSSHGNLCINPWQANWVFGYNEFQ
ncbi:unnamed protein product [Paramecium primaurelia]|uniref:Transmembrane protein n=1 Tax=Paramecium primaurelia TaxID=5886 RepID=A0A8S1PSX2_PARPR|nr:unnamed protein product [Paramecium primaurelia]